MKPSTLAAAFFRVSALVLAALIVVLVPPIASKPGEAFALEAHAADSKRPQPYALVFGTVWGPDSRPVYAVRVRVRRASEKKSRWELYSDHSGEFAFRLPSGTADYVVWADLNGYKSIDKRHLRPGAEVQVHIENDERADISLHLK